ncbi:MAG: hypothetical protein IJP38_10455 [Oscillospiraceae bacterium]|nr:hypothetical protein [Oscillospiraceae bacterium]
MQAIAEKRRKYDFSAFEREEATVSDGAKRTRTAERASARKAAKPAISGFAIFCSVTVFVMLIALLYSYANLTEAADINRSRRAELEDMREEIQMLEVSRNQRLGALQIRDYAVTKLGMSKIDKSQITYVSTSGGDRFEIGEPGEKEMPKLISGLAKGFSIIVEFIN